MKSYNHFRACLFMLKTKDQEIIEDPDQLQTLINLIKKFPSSKELKKDT